MSEHAGPCFNDGPNNTRHQINPMTRRCMKCGRSLVHIHAGGYHCDGRPDIQVVSVSTPAELADALDKAPASGPALEYEKPVAINKSFQDWAFKIYP